MWSCAAAQLPPEEEVRLFNIRQNAVKRFRTIAIVMVVASVLSIGTGIVLLIAAAGGGWPLVSGSPIFSGLVVLAAAICGLVLGCTKSEWTTEEERSKQRCLVVAFYALAVSSCSLCGISIGYTIAGLVACSGIDMQTCGHHHRAENYANAFGVFFGVFLLVTSIIVCVMFCYYKKAFKFFSASDRLEQMQYLISQQQQRITSLSHSVGQSHPTGQNPPVGYGTLTPPAGQTPVGYGTYSPTAPPPPYTEKQTF